MSPKIMLILLLAFVCVSASPSDPVPVPNNQGWMDRHNGFVRNTQNSNGSIPIVFFGASIVDGWDNEGKPVWDEKYLPLGVTNYGIGGDKVEHVLWRIYNGEIQGLNPKLIAVHIGGNNISGGQDTDEEIAAGIIKLVTTLRYMLPSTKILLFGILPRRNADTFVRVANINIRLARLDNGDSIRFLNMMDQFALSWGQVKPELYQSDSLHLVTAGYVVWDNTMSHLFHEMLDA